MSKIDVEEYNIPIKYHIDPCPYHIYISINGDAVWSREYKPSLDIHGVVV